MRKTKNTTRRSVLQKSGIAIAGMVGSTSITAATKSKLSRVQMAMGSVKSPVARNTRKELRQRAIEAYRQRNGEDPKLAVRARDSDDTPVVGYAIGFDNDGVPHYMSVQTPDPTRVKERHAELNDRVATFKKQVNSPNATTDSITTQSKSWQFEMGIYAGGGASNDAGSIDHNLDLYRLTNDGVSDGETFAAVQIMTTKPDVYSNLSGDTYHDWSPANNSPGTESNALVDYGPERTFSGDGTKTAYLSARNTTLSWSWTHNGDVTTDTNTSANEADQFKGDFTQSYGSGTGDKEEEMGSGTAVETNQPSTDKYYDLVTLTAEETFFYTNGGSVYDEQVISDEQTLDVNYAYL